MNRVSHVLVDHAGRFSVASTTDPELAVAMVRAVLELKRRGG